DRHTQEPAGHPGHRGHARRGIVPDVSEVLHRRVAWPPTSSPPTPAPWKQRLICSNMKGKIL
ncbi:MAG: hypothetical protein RBT80_16310, partial [Candidatus Vecturithrix sp.]|nr:hypothetical protein [Candidatus Vecturithrix sp.]